MYVLRSACRSCGSSDLELVLSLGELPLPGALLSSSDLGLPERLYPLDVVLCRECALVQLMQTVSPGEIYGKRYRHLSSVSEAYVAHAYASAERLIQERRLDGASYVIEIGSNDGTMLRHLQTRGVATMGIDPSPVAVAEARRNGIATLQSFFTRDLAAQLATDGRKADVIIANGVLSRVPDPHGFLIGIRSLLDANGVAIIEVPYVRDLVRQSRFDAIDHEHLCYFSLHSLAALIESANLFINHVEHFPLNGGVLRAYASRLASRQPSVQACLDEEAACGMAEASFYSYLGERMTSIRGRLRAHLHRLKAQGKSIVGYGASAPAATLLNLGGIDGRYLDYVVDCNPERHGAFLPGSRLPVLHPDRMITNRPGYVLVLDADSAEVALHREESYLEQGGHLIEVFPEPAIL